VKKPNDTTARAENKLDLWFVLGVAMPVLGLFLLLGGTFCVKDLGSDTSRLMRLIGMVCTGCAIWAFPGGLAEPRRSRF